MDHFILLPWEGWDTLLNMIMSSSMLQATLDGTATRMPPHQYTRSGSYFIIASLEREG
jgi:hypothetical protein